MPPKKTNQQFLLALFVIFFHAPQKRRSTISWGLSKSPQEEESASWSQPYGGSFGCWESQDLRKV